MRVQSTALIVGLTALSYAALYLVNEYVFSVFGFSAGVSWIFLPSGVRLVAILLFEKWGALGVVLGSLMVAFHDALLTDPVTVAVAACISGLAPLLARQAHLRFTNLDVNLTALSARGLLRLAVTFSALSAALHQSWYVWRGVSDHPFDSVLVMFTGDMLGAMVVLYAAKVILSLGARVRGG
jgi:hypothetical protein